MLGKLVITIDGKPFGEFELTKPVTSIGRKVDNDISINYPLVSSRHCQILSIASDWFIEDLNSTNGTCINGKTIKKSGLQNNDVVSIGNCEIKFMLPNQMDDDDDDDHTVIYVKGSEPKSSGGVPSFQNPAPIPAPAPVPPPVAAKPVAPKYEPPKPPPAGSATIGGKLQIISGINAGKEMALQKQLTTIGKPGSQLAAITKRAQGYFLIHVDGPPNVFPSVNGKSIGSQAAQLNDHDLIEVAGIKMEFFLG